MQPVTMPRTAVAIVLIASLSLLLARRIAAQDRSAPAPEPKSSGARIVAAVIDGEAVFADEVRETLSIALAGRQVAAEALPALEAQSLEQLIGRRLVEAHLLENGYAPNKAQIEQAKASFISELRTKRSSLKEYLEERNMTEGKLQSRLSGQLAWNNGWQKYLAQRLTDERFEQYLQAHPGEFDGTERRASHVLLRVDRPHDPNALRGVIQRARAIRDQIVEGELTFSVAVEKYSDGPSRRHQGDLGFFPRHGVMVESFAKAAFELEKDEISEPVVSPFGIHLIRCTEIKPGSKSWQDVRSELTPLARKALIDTVARELFAALASRLRADVTIEFSGRVPHFKPGTREVVLPEGGGDGSQSE